MKTMTRAFAVAAIGAMVGGVALTASAQPAGPGSAPPAHGQGGPGGGGMPGPGGFHMGGHRMGDPTDYLNRLRGEIEITPAQAPAWDAFAKVVLDTTAQIRAGREGMTRHKFLEMSTQERLAVLMKRRALFEQAFTNVKAAADALLPVLNDTQKVRALMSVPGLAPPGMAMRSHGMMRGHAAPASTTAR